MEEEDGGGGLVRFIFYWCVLARFWINPARCYDTREGWRRVIGEEEKVRRG